MRSTSLPIAVAACTLIALAPAIHGQRQARPNRIVDLLSTNKVVLGWFAPARTPEAAMKAAADPAMDFVFVNMEQVNSYNPAEVKTFLEALRQGSTAARPGPPLMLRIPIFHSDPMAARQRVTEVLNLGVEAVV